MTPEPEDPFREVKIALEFLRNGSMVAYDDERFDDESELNTVIADVESFLRERGAE